MKSLHRFFPLSLLAFFCLFLMACPVSSSYPLGEKGKEKIDKNMIGKWKTDKADHEAKKINVRMADDFSYDVTVEEEGSSFMADTKEFKGWLTKLEGKTFFVLQEINEGKATETYYVYHITIGKDGFTTHDIGCLVDGTSAITSTEAYRNEVKASMSKENFLSSEAKWVKQ